MRYVTNSETAVMRRCARKWYLTHYRQLRPRTERLSDNTTIGNLAHAALAGLYNESHDPLAVIVYESEMLIQEQEAKMVEGLNSEAMALIDQNIQTVREAAEFASIMIEGYLQWLEEEGEDSYLTFVSAEQEMTVKVPLENMAPVSLLAKLDARFIDQRSNARVFMDHKTVANFADREKWAHMDPQFLFYGMVEYLTLMAEQGGEQLPEGSWTDGGIFNMLRKVKRTARANPPFYKRKSVRHSTIQLRNFFIRLSGEIARILQAEEALDSGVDPMMVCAPSPSRDCDWDCAYMTLCGFMDDGSDSEGYVEAAFEKVNIIDRYTIVPGLRT